MLGFLRIVSLIVRKLKTIENFSTVDLVDLNTSGSLNFPALSGALQHESS